MEELCMNCRCTKDVHQIYHFESGCWCTACIDRAMVEKTELGTETCRLVVAANAVVTRNSAGIWHKEHAELRDAAGSVSALLAQAGYTAP